MCISVFEWGFRWWEDWIRTELICFQNNYLSSISLFKSSSQCRWKVPEKQPRRHVCLCPCFKRKMLSMVVVTTADVMTHVKVAHAFATQQTSDCIQGGILQLFLLLSVGLSLLFCECVRERGCVFCVPRSPGFTVNSAPSSGAWGEPCMVKLLVYMWAYVYNAQLCAYIQLRDTG